MDIKRHLGLLRLLLVVVAVFWGLAQGLAQTKAASQSKPTTKAPAQSQATAPAPQDRVWVKDPNSVMQMRKMTNAQRRAAAERSKARRAKAENQRRQNAKGGVQQ